MLKKTISLLLVVLLVLSTVSFATYAEDLETPVQDEFKIEEYETISGYSLSLTSVNHKAKISIRIYGSNSQFQNGTLKLYNNKGLFQSFWIKNSSGVGNKNVILWAKPGTDIGKDTQNIDGYDYTRYTPDRIVFDSLQSTYRKIEFESLAIDLNGRMLIACNANYTNGSSADGIFKLTKSNGSNF